MKHILLATTALVASAGIASAEIELSGSAEMGIIGGSGEVGGVDVDIETQFHTDIDVTFTMSGETDNGLTFGASIDLDESDNDGADNNGTDPTGSRAFANTTQGGETIFIAYGAAKLTMGDVDGALDAAMKEAIIGSAINDDHEHAGYNGNSGFDGGYDGQIAQFSYAASGFTGYLSVELDDFGNTDPIWGLGVAYSTELAGLTLGVGLGYQTVEDASTWGLSVDTTFNNGIQAILNYSTVDFGVAGAEDQKHFGLALGYTMNALTIGVNYGKFDDVLGVDGDTSKGFGLAVDYDLGGGAEVQFGYGKSDMDIGGVESDLSTWSLGVAMSF
ncbi:Porin [Pelagimonas phthalicica]|uniref:Porin n=1 Tax=Pelagimonas phthalicica TaxID=1037362 RepID=A0A238JAJ6_9RHOB|nr:porin [Pelagimonas phthalicica]TDS94586.1 outer membrane protein OmpU [Pelagimonas phthalicica]SMX26886.1 Porin [Pelagimonas phthalicica]